MTLVVPEPLGQVARSLVQVELVVLPFQVNRIRGELVVLPCLAIPVELAPLPFLEGQEEQVLHPFQEVLEELVHRLVLVSHRVEVGHLLIVVEVGCLPFLEDLQVVVECHYLPFQADRPEEEGCHLLVLSLLVEGGCHHLQSQAIHQVEGGFHLLNLTLLVEEECHILVLVVHLEGEGYHLRRILVSLQVVEEYLPLKVQEGHQVVEEYLIQANRAILPEVVGYREGLQEEVEECSKVLKEFRVSLLFGVEVEYFQLLPIIL